MPPSVATQSAAPDVIRVACDCGFTWGAQRSNVGTCPRCKGGNLVALGKWEPQPGLLTIFDLFNRGRLTYESPIFGKPVAVTRGRP